MAKSFISSLVNSRQRQANRFVSGFLVTLDDETLKRHGYDRKSLKAAQNNTIYPL